MVNILILGYKRPDKINELLKILSEIDTNNNILVHIDGAKNNEDKVEVNKTQDIVLKYRKEFNAQFEWKFNDLNLGCKYGVISGLKWAFEQHDDLIILEDDIRPSKFFLNMRITI